MLKSIRPFYSIVCIAMILQVACSDEELNPEIAISPEVRLLLLDFIKEANGRNVLIDTTNVEVVFVDQLDTQTLGACGLGFYDYQGTGINRIEILSTGDCWKDRGLLERENLFFHELGHAVLGRFHLDDQLPNESKKSMMCGACNNFNVYDASTLFKRSYYLDELFDETVPNPTWAVRKTVKSTVFGDNFDGDQLDWKFITTDGVDNINNYEGKLVDSKFVSSPKSLLISSQRIDDSHASAFWQYTLSNPDIPALSNVTLSCQIRAESVQGIGAGIELIGYGESQNQEEQVLYKSSIETRNILGSQSFAKYELSIVCFPENVDRLQIRFRMEPNTIGQIYLDDVELKLTR